jgi:DNA polymerase-3 subunit delta
MTKDAAQPSKNVYIFHGEDDFSLRQKINVWKTEFAKKFSGTSIITISGENLNETDLIKKFEEILTPSLFSSKKLIVARNCLPTKAAQEILTAKLTDLLKSLPSDYFLIFWQDSMDRRLGFIKNLLKEINLVEFHMPHGLELNAWIKKQSTLMGLNLDNAAIDKLAQISGRDFFEEKKAGGRVVERKEAFNLWQVYSELEKLASRGGNIDARIVGELATPVVPENVFALSDAIVAQNKKAAIEVLENLMAEENIDEKSMAIKLIGLISEQLRSMLVVGTLKNQNMDQNQIANFLGWSPGRVFITVRHAANMQSEKLKKLLAKLLEIDSTVKSSDTNPKLLIDLLIAQ